MRVLVDQYRFHRLDGSGRPAERVGVVQPVAHGPVEHGAWCQAAMSGMRSDVIETGPPTLDHRPSLGEAHEELLVEAFGIR